MYKVILVDDELTTCEVLRDFITDENVGFEVSGVFGNGQQAWEYLCEFPVHCVITDIKMPYMDGLELAKNIYHSKKSIKTIILSGYGEFEYAQQAIKYGVSDYQLKPIDYDKLAEILIQLKTELDEEYGDVSNENISEGEDSLKGPELYNKATLEMALRYLEDHFCEAISREKVAEIFYMNAAYFGSCFKRHTGKTFTEYLTELRIKKSIELLRTNISVEEVARKIGYGSARHFGRIFKAMTGFTPSEYRVNILKQEFKQ